MRYPITLDFDTWVTRYQPINNSPLNITPLNLAWINDISRERPNLIWTEVDIDGSTYMINGYHWVNRMGYYITEKPWIDDEEIEVLVWEDIKDE